MNREMEIDYDPEYWVMLAECRGSDVDFFPDKNNEVAIKAAKKLCAQCVVTTECLEDALSTRATWGIRGGITEWDRKNINTRSQAEARIRRQ